MLIRCPSCSATYEVPSAMLDPPRTVRCAKCAHDWVAEAIDESALSEAPAEPALPEPPAETLAEAAEPEIAVDEPEELEEPEDSEAFPEMEPALGDTPLSAIERLAMPGDLSPSLRRRDHLLTAAWAVSFAALAALGVAGYTERDTLMRQWPASKRVYATLGLAPLDRSVGDGKSVDAKAGTEPTEHGTDAGATGR